MEASRPDKNNRDNIANHIFLSPKVVEIHIQRGVPIPEEMAKLIWGMNEGLRRDDEDSEQQKLF